MSEEELRKEQEAKEKRTTVLRLLDSTETLFREWYGYSEETAKEVEHYFNILADIACVCTLKGADK